MPHKQRMHFVSSSNSLSAQAKAGSALLALKDLWEEFTYRLMGESLKANGQQKFNSIWYQTESRFNIWSQWIWPESGPLCEENTAGVFFNCDLCFDQWTHFSCHIQGSTSSRSCQLRPPARPHWRRAAGQQGKPGAPPPSPSQTGSPPCHQSSLELPLGKWLLRHPPPPVEAITRKLCGWKMRERGHGCGTITGIQQVTWNEANVRSAEKMLTHWSVRNWQKHRLQRERRSE